MENLVLIVGLPGTGKTTVAGALAERLGAYHLSSDRLREELDLRGQYGAAEKALVYRRLLERTGDLLRAGQSVVVDATLFRRDLRLPYRRLARAVGAAHALVELRAPAATVRKRVARSRRYSEADFSVYERIAAAYEPVDQPHLEVSTEDRTVADLVEDILNYIADRTD